MNRVKIALVLTACVLAAPAMAAEKGPGASEYSPGHKMQNETGESTGPGASDYTPGHQMQNEKGKSAGPGASEYSPGHQAQDKPKDSGATDAGSGTEGKDTTTPSMKK